MSIAEHLTKGFGAKKPGGITGKMEHQPEHEGEGEKGVPEHLQEMHAKMGGKHMHVHSDEMGNHTSHHIGEDGQVQGPHDHENIEALKEHMGRFLNEEEGEGGEYGGHSSGGHKLFE